MSWEDDDFERELAAYSEIETTDAPTDSVPQTIQSYQHLIQANNNSSIFDTDYSLPATNGDTNSCHNVGTNSHDNLFNDDQVIKVASGRGRGGRNVFFRPGDLNGKPNDEQEIIQRIRKLVPMGFGNEVTEYAVRAHQQSKLADQESSAHSSPVLSSSTSGSPQRQSGQHNSLPSTSRLKITPLKESSSSSQASDTESSDYFTSQDFVPSPRDSLDENKNLKADDDSPKSWIRPNESEQAKENIRPASICDILKRTREEWRKHYLNQQRRKDSENFIQDNDVEATQRKIKEILLQDRAEKIRKNQSSESSDSRESVLSWRQRTNSPPTAFSWQYNSKRKKSLNLNSNLDFPPLK